MKLLASCWAGLLLCAAAPFALAANTWTVTSTGSGGACTANSTSDPNCTLDAAIYTAANGDTVRFAPSVQGQTICGTYPNITYQNTPPSVTIDGSPNGVVLDSCGSGPIFALDSGNVTFSHLTLQNSPNVAIYDTGANVTVDSCTFKGNSASGGAPSGGAIAQVGGSVFVVNSTFVGNTASGNGGAIGAYGNVVISNSTITGNHATNGGGIGGYGITVMSSIIAGNSATNSPDAYIFSSAVSLGYNIVGNTSGSGLSAATGDQFNVDPLFVAAGLANNGGATQTVALRSLSPARSGGNCAGNDGSNGFAVIPAETLDQIGHARTSPGAIGCSVGAFDMTSIFYGGFE
jgi:hypothetical protein